MKIRAFCAALLLVLYAIIPSHAQQALVIDTCGTLPTNLDLGPGKPIYQDKTGKQCVAASVSASASVTNPTSTLTPPTTTTAYTAGSLVCTSATAATCNTALASAFFTIPNSGGAFSAARTRLRTADATATAWSSAQMQMDLWSAAPTFTNGDRGAWALATGSASHLGSYLCTMSAEFGDGAYAECYPAVGNGAVVKLASGTSVWWTLQAVNGGGVTSAAQPVWTATLELQN